MTMNYYKDSRAKYTLRLSEDIAGIDKISIAIASRSRVMSQELDVY